MAQEFLGVFSVLFIMLGILALAAWAVKRFGLIPGQPKTLGKTKQVQILESQALDARNRIVVVRWQGRDYLLGTGQNGVRLLDQSGNGNGEPRHNFERMLEDAKDQDL